MQHTHPIPTLLLSLASIAATAYAQCAIVPGSTFGLPGSGPGVLSEVLRLRHWDPDGPGPQPPLVLACGTFPAAGTAGGSAVAVHDPVLGTWAPVGAWTFGRGQACIVLPNGDLVASAMDFMLGQAAVARWNGTAWIQLGGTFDNQVIALTATPNGDIYAGGYFQQVGGVPIQSVAQWTGSAWQPVGNGLPAVDELVTMPNGDVIAGGFGGVQRWNGSAWVNLGSGFPGTCLALEVLPNGDLLAGVTWGTALGRWDGSSWTPIPIPAGRPEAIHALPNGDLLIGGAFTLGPWSGSVIRQNGTQWQPTVAPSGWAAFSLLGLADGDVMVGGLFGNGVSLGAVRLTTTCPATVAPLGPGCPSSGGNNVLAAGLAWTGGTWSTVATGLPPQAFVLLVNGFATNNLPLSSLLPSGQPGCNLLVRPDHVTLLASTGAQAFASFELPDSPLLAGTVFHHQMLALDIGAGPTIVSATATNAQTLVVGTF